MFEDQPYGQQGCSRVSKVEYDDICVRKLGRSRVMRTLLAMARSLQLIPSGMESSGLVLTSKVP